jgi:hypothetical protein
MLIRLDKLILAPLIWMLKYFIRHRRSKKAMTQILRIAKLEKAKSFILGFVLACNSISMDFSQLQRLRSAIITRMGKPNIFFFKKV